MPEQTDAALEAVCVAVERAQPRLEAVLARAAVLREQRAKGLCYSELVRTEDRPLLVEVLTQVLEDLATAGATFRRSEAGVLHAEGFSQEAVAALFGVTRQRVSVLLQER